MRFPLVVVCALALGSLACPSSGAIKQTPAAAKTQSACATCHLKTTPGIVKQWQRSAHYLNDVGCIQCHRATEQDADAFLHEGSWIAVVNTPRDCGRCHEPEWRQFDRSRHAKAAAYSGPEAALGVTVAGLDGNFPAFTSGGTPVDGHAARASGCDQCHGSKLALMATDGSRITVDQLDPGPDGLPRNREALAKIKRHTDGAPVYDFESWPNTGSGRINLDGSRGSCSACHSRHDFSRRRARRPENCGKCHQGAAHGQADIFERSKHGIAYRDTKNNLVDIALKLGRKDWQVGRDYSDAPTCATCHMAGHPGNEGKVTHDPRERLHWNNQGPVSVAMNTDAEGDVVGEGVVDEAGQKRERMAGVCRNCHSANYVAGFFSQYDALITLYNEKFGLPAQKIVSQLQEDGLLTPQLFDESVEWAWFKMWHDAGRQLRFGASMMSPGYTQWKGMRQVVESFYLELMGQVRAVLEQAENSGKNDAAAKTRQLVDEILARPEHRWQRRNP